MMDNPSSRPNSNSMVYVLLLVLLTSSSLSPVRAEPAKTLYLPDVMVLTEQLSIPGMALMIKGEDGVLLEQYLGYADLEQAVPVDAKTTFPIASITKVFTAVLVFKLAEQERLSLDDSVNSYLDQPILSDDIKIKHILSHTSERTPGQYFHYSARFSLLTQVIEKAAGLSFKEYLTQTIIAPLGLTNTSFLDQDSALNSQRIASPYNYGIPPEKGRQELGYSASAGLVSNPEDLAKFFNALYNNKLVKAAALKQMMTPAAEGSPYGMGVFSDSVWNTRVNWAYGQYDSYSSLFIYLPQSKLALVMLANNNLIGDPPRLINGDLRSSLFAMAFLEHFAFAKMPQSFDLFKQLAMAQQNAFLARFDLEYLQQSKEILEQVFSQNTAIENYASLNLLHTLVFLKDIQFYLELGPFNSFDQEIETVGELLKARDINNPYLNIYLATFYVRNKQNETAEKYYRNISELKNATPNWYTKEAELFLQDK